MVVSVRSNVQINAEKGSEFTALFQSGLLWNLLIGEVRSEDISTSGWMSNKVFWINLITILALERTNKNCYEKGLWMIQ